MLEQIHDHLPTFSKLFAHLRESIHSCAIFGVTVAQSFNTQQIATALVVGGLSAFGGAYITAERTAVELKQYAREQGEFRSEMRAYMRDREIEFRTIYERQAKVEAVLMTTAPGAMSGMSGMSGNGNRK